MQNAELLLHYAHEEGYKWAKEKLPEDKQKKLVRYLHSKRIYSSSYQDYIRACIYLKLDLTEDKNAFPHDFTYWHDIRIDEYRTAKALAEEKAKKELLAKFKAVAEKYMPLQHSKADYVVVISMSPTALVKEGEMLHHCVGSMGYDQKFVKEQSLIFFVREKSKPNTPYITIEYSPEKRRILQKLVQFAPDPDEADKVSFLYRTHHETNEYHGYLSNRYSKERNACYDNCFVEGISGGNSTDRIIRREPYSFDMFYQHIYAAERRVAIIDERVFKDIHGVDASECLFEGQILEGPKAYRSLQYSQKGIDVFSIVPLDADKKKFAIIGCEIKEEPEGKCCCHQLAEIENEKNYNLKIENHATIYNKYDYVSIHQGLLDKLYELFREKRKEKINAVNSICELFRVEDSLFEDKKNVAFHPNFIIHSGRGKCTNEDMPQQVPFVSYAQLSQAINDCKFNLVQLFDFLRYENN